MRGRIWTFDRIRALTIAAIFAEAYFFDCLVLKGGNALALALEISERASLDLDFSIEADFSDPTLAASKLHRALAHKFLPAGYSIFDYEFNPRPRQPRPGQEEWGGYLVTFKVAETDTYLRFNSKLEDLRRRAIVTGPGPVRTIRIDLSKFEYTVGKLRRSFEDETIYVYSPRMIAIEKLRALCQQLPSYTLARNTTARAR